MLVHSISVARSTYYTQLFERLRELPGVESVSGTDDLPLRQFQGSGSAFEVQGRPASESTLQKIRWSGQPLGRRVTRETCQ
jgi:hypothetical protein